MSPTQVSACSFRFVAAGAPTGRLPPWPIGDSERKYADARTGLPGWLGFREIRRLLAAPCKGQWLLAVTATASFVVAVDTLVVSTALGTMRDLHASLSSLGWTVNAYFLSFCGAVMAASVLGARHAAPIV